MDWSTLIRDEVKPLVAYAPGLRGSDVRERSGVDEIAKLSSNENPYGPFPAATAAMRAVLGHLNRYPDGSSRALLGKLAGHLDVPEERLVLANGSNELLRILAEAVLVPGDEAVFAAPSFVVYPMVTQLVGATKVAVPLDADAAHDLDALARAVTTRTKVVFLCNPNNPTGTIFAREAFERFLERTPESVLIVLDEAYFEYVTDPEHVNGLDYLDDERVVVLRTFSKMYSLAGARCGYGVMAAPLVEAINKVRDPFNVNMVAQAGAYYSLDDPDEVARRRAENAAERERLYAALDSLADGGAGRISYVPSQTNFVWVRVPDAQNVYEQLISRGVIVRSFGGEALRIGIGLPAENDRLIAALRAVVSGD